MIFVQSNATLVTVLHSDSLSPHPVIQDELDQYLFRSILQHSTYWFELKSLVSQSRGEVSPLSLLPRSFIFSCELIISI